MAAPTQYYVDPAIAGNSGTGTIGDPFGDLQYALDTVGTAPGRDATNGDQFNIKSGTAEVLAASLTLATYGTPAEGAPLILRGYTSAANDGGIGEVDCNGFKFWTATTYTDVILVDLLMHNFGNNNGIDYAGSGLRTIVYHCKIHKGASTPTTKRLVSTAYTVINCWVYNAGTTGVGIYGYGHIIDNYIYNCPTGISSAFNNQRNIIVDCTTGINASADTHNIKNNSIFSSTASTGTGINIAAGNSDLTVINNIIEGYSGAGGKAIAAAADIGILGYNAFYNNTANNSVGDVLVDLTANDVACASSPFVNAAGGDFSLNTAVVGAIDGAFPGAWYGPASTTDHADIGAVQNGAGAGGNVNHLRGKL